MLSSTMHAISLQSSGPVKGILEKKQVFGVVV